METFSSDITATVRLQAGDDRLICDAARVSTLGDDADAVIKSLTDNERLIGYLMREKHGSPFEHGYLCVILTAPIFVFWDHVRHRIGVSYNIESSRYRKLRPRFFVAEQARTQAGKPGHYVMTPGTDKQTTEMQRCQEAANVAAWRLYERQLNAGIAREQAMQCLPMNTIISGYVSFNPRSLMKFLELRLGPARQEMQTVAAQYLALLKRYWPAVHEAFEAGGRIAP